MKILFLFLLLFYSSNIGCARHKSHDTKTPMELVQENRDFILSQIDDSVFKHRCDKLTFFALYSAFGVRQDLKPFIYDESFHRDIELCYPEDSRSEISLDPMLMVLHHIVSHKDQELFDKLFEIGKRSGWIMGDGPVEYTNIYLLVPQIYQLKEEFNLIDPTYHDILAGYKGHITAMYILLKGRIDGSISEIEYQVLKELFDNSPENPLYSAIYHRFTDGDQSYTINLLNKIWGHGIFPLGVSGTGWGSAPDSVLYVTIVGIMEGK